MKKSIRKNKMSTINNENTAQSAAAQLRCANFDAHNLEHLNKILTYSAEGASAQARNQKTVRIFGTNEDPWFCGRDVCDILKYEKYRDALLNNVDDENKKSLKDLVVQFNWTTIKFSYNDKSVRIFGTNEDP